ncbi:MAG: hypothetical protein HYR96_06165 [Deltaproteobacteria bacterium]|nr:hypothetical protein [Deltaproteobacteria bacterium]MBI3295281.1 hypothetical protein [Deltaproteobacteria bacterium]
MNLITKLSLMTWVATTAFAGTLTIINNQTSGSSGTVDVKCNVQQKVTLTIADTGANSLVSPTGIDFGNVDASGTPGAVPGTAVAGGAQYVTNFILSANRTGSGNVTLTARRSVAGNFNATDGVLIDDSSGTTRPLDGAGTPVTVVASSAAGDFNKRLGITVHSADSGSLVSTVQFTLSAL